MFVSKSKFSDSTKWQKYNFKYDENYHSSKEGLLNWTILAYNPTLQDYVLAGVITKVAEDYVEFLGDPSVVDTNWFQESSVGYSLECLS